MTANDTPQDEVVEDEVVEEEVELPSDDPGDNFGPAAFPPAEEAEEADDDEEVDEDPS